MEKYALTPSGFLGAGSEPTLGVLKHRILSDVVLDIRQKQEALELLERETRGASDSTPLAALMSRIGGGALGLLFARYFGMGIPGQILATAGGYGLGKMLYDTYQDMADPSRNIHRWR